MVTKEEIIEQLNKLYPNRDTNFMSETEDDLSKKFEAISDTLKARGFIEAINFLTKKK